MTTSADNADAPMTRRRSLIALLGGAMAIAQIAAAGATAPYLTGEGSGSAGAIVALWAASLPWSVIAVLLLARKADIADVFTAAMLVCISAGATFALVAGLDVRGTPAERDLVDTLFFGVTSGALSALLVWGIAMATARLLHLPGARAAADSPEG